MFLTNYNYGIKLIDLVDYTNPDITFSDVVDNINKLLSANCKEEYFINDDLLWNDFIKRFTRKFMYRTLSFDTYFEFCIKLNDVLTSNKVKLNNMYNAKLIKFNPMYNKMLITDTDNTSTKDGRTNYSNTENSVRKTDGFNKLEYSNVSNSNGNNKRTDDITTKTKSGGSNSDFNLHSDAPRSSVNVSDLFKTDDNYITDSQNRQGNFNESGSNTQTGTVINEISNGSNDNGNKKNDYKDNITIDSGNTSLTVDSIKDTLKGKQLLQGYEGNPTDLIKKYINFVIDCNEYLLNQIEDANLFMSIVL